MTEGRRLLMTMLSLLSPSSPALMKAISKLNAPNCLYFIFFPPQTCTSHQAHAHHLLFSILFISSLAAGLGQVTAYFLIASDGTSGSSIWGIKAEILLQ